MPQCGGGADQTAGGQDWRAWALTLKPEEPGARGHFSDQAETQCEGETQGRSGPDWRVAGAKKIARRCAAHSERSASGPVPSAPVLSYSMGETRHTRKPMPL